MKKLETRNGPAILIDDEDFQWVSGYRWHWWGRYVQTHLNGKMVRLHRKIAKAKPSECVDHVNGNRADNTRKNLRICTRSENLQNRKVNCDSVTGLKGVGVLPSGKFRVRIQAFGKRKHYGVFKTKAEAEKARIKIARELHGKFFRER